MSNREIREMNKTIDTLSGAVARLLFDRGNDDIQLGENGYMIAVTDGGQVLIDGLPVGEPDTAFRHPGALVEIDW